jgi:hypothetical protein
MTFFNSRLGLTKPRRGKQREETLSIEEIQAKLPSEWILVVDPVTNESLEVLRGKVAWHSKNRDEVYQKAIELRPQRAAYLYTGTIPENAAVVV